MMETERLFSLRNVWFTASVGAVIGIAAIAALIGFIWIPLEQSNKTVAGLWDAICTAAGAPEAFRPIQQQATPAPGPSDVVVSARMLNPADSTSIGRGATLAAACTSCHSAAMSQAGFPYLAGQHGAAIYKQLRDFKSGHRESAVMVPLVANLGDQEMRDLAGYFASLPKELNPLAKGAQQEAPVIVSNGSPMRNIAACSACHGDIDGKIGSPRLDGEPEAYLQAQLRAFATGARHNDIQEQMRNVARHMTPGEIDAAARFYAGR
jgi:cytochrome c553